MPEEIKLYTVEELSAILNVSRRTLYNYIKGDQLKAVMIGRKWRVSERELQAFLERGTEVGYFQRIASPSQTTAYRNAKRAQTKDDT